MEILSVNSPAFRQYGRVINTVDFTGLVAALRNTPIPENVVYEPSVRELEAVPVMQELTNIVYGEMPIQIGYCNGHNGLLNALEYHRSSEINVMATDAVLMLGLQADIEGDFTYDTAKVKAFLVPAGTAVEVYATTLHYAPCGVNGEGFQVAIVLPKGTNYPLEASHAPVLPGGGVFGEDALITAKNKWLIGHKDGNLDPGAYLGLRGKNLNINE